MLPNQPGFMSDYSEQEHPPAAVEDYPHDSILEFGAPWCGHCKAAQPSIEHFFEQNPQLHHIKIYDGKGKRLGRVFRVKLWPTLILLRNGQEVARVVRPIQDNDMALLAQ